MNVTKNAPMHEAPTLAPAQPPAPSPCAGASASTANGALPDAFFFPGYELLGEIARGGMGVVYKARQMRPERIVALKVVLAGQFAGEADIRRFHAEAEAAAQLDHPGIVPVYVVGQHEGQHFFSMAYVEGQSLAARLSQGPLTAREAAALVARIAAAVDYANERGVIHRDLKPGNILLDAAGEPRVTDFGLAKRIEGDSALTATGQILGTPSFMPPEQAAGKIGDIDRTADVYSLGAILYALSTGRPPFHAATAMETLMQVLEDPPPPPRALNRRIPRDLETIALKCLQKNRRQRYASARALAEDLQRFLDERPIEARRISTTARFLRWCRRNVAKTAAILAAIVAAGAIVAGAIMWSIDQSQWRAKEIEYAVASRNDRLAIQCDGIIFQFRNVAVATENPQTGKLRTDGAVFASGVTLAIEVFSGKLQATRHPRGIPGVFTIAITDRDDKIAESPDYALYLSNNGASWSTKARSGDIRAIETAHRRPGRLDTIVIGGDGDVAQVIYVK